MLALLYNRSDCSVPSVKTAYERKMDRWNGLIDKWIYVCTQEFHLKFQNFTSQAF